MTQPDTLFRRWRLRVLALLVAPVVALGVVEAGARIAAAPAEAELAFNAPDNAPDGLYVNSHALGHRPAPGFDAMSVSPGYRVHLRVNSLGLRGPEPAEDDGSPRMLIGGDSFTFAAQVDEDDSFVGLLAQGRQTFNGGADGYGTWQALEQYRQLDQELGIDELVVVFFAGNDLEDNGRWRQALAEAQRLPDGAVLPALASPGLQRWLGRNSVLMAHWKVVQRTRELQDPASLERQRWARELSIFTGGGTDALERAMVGTERALEALRDEVAARGDQLLVAVAPPGFAVDPRRTEAAFGLVGHPIEAAALSAPSDAVMASLEGLGVAACDLQPALVEATESGTRTYFDFDGHWTPEGHAVVADTLEGCLRARRGSPSSGDEPRSPLPQD